MKRRRVAILGATGSIGMSARKVARMIPDRMEVVGLSANQNKESLIAAAQEFQPKLLCIGNTAHVESIRTSSPTGTKVVSGEEGLLELATHPEVDLVLIAIVGIAGLKPALAAIEAGKDIAVASKEILVMAGEIVMAAAARKGVRVLPIDSEHNAIFQCLEGRLPEQVRRLILTCSGGPFRSASPQEIANASPELALKHPVWSMGKKITLDSATLFNKGLEMIEARWLFDVDMDRIDVVVHPQSIIHSMVEFIDGSCLAQLSHSDMCFPIQYAITWPDRIENGFKTLDLTTIGRLEFEAPRTDVFPALNLARHAGTTGGTMPAVLNAANECAASFFLDHQIRFSQIWELVASVMIAHQPIAHPTLDELVNADAWARSKAKEIAAEMHA